MPTPLRHCPLSLPGTSKEAEEKLQVVKDECKRLQQRMEQAGKKYKGYDSWLKAQEKEKEQDEFREWCQSAFDPFDDELMATPLLSQQACRPEKPPK